MDKYLTDMLSKSLEAIKEWKTYYEEQEEKTLAILREIDNLVCISTCAVCGKKLKDVSEIVKRNPMIHSELPWYSNDLREEMSHDGHINLYHCSNCGSGKIFESDVIKNPIYTWHPGEKLPGKNTRAKRILDEHPQIDELLYGVISYLGGNDYCYMALIGGQWYISSFIDVVKNDH